MKVDHSSGNSLQELQRPYRKCHNACRTYTHLQVDLESSLGNLQNLMQLNTVQVLVRLYYLRKNSKDMEIGICVIWVGIFFI